MKGLLAQGGSGEVQDYVVGKLAYGDDIQDTYIPDSDPADEEDEGDTTSGLYSLLINPTLPLNAKMQVRPHAELWTACGRSGWAGSTSGHGARLQPRQRFLQQQRQQQADG